MPPRRTKPEVIESVVPVSDDPRVKLANAEIDARLKEMMDDMNATFGEDQAAPLSSAATLSKIDEWVSTGSYVVDKVLLGGRSVGSLVPYGRQTEVSGLPGTGKTTLCAHLAAQTQAMGGIVVVTDTEERIDHPYWQGLGVDTDRIINLKARTLEDVFDRQYEFIKASMEKWSDIPILMLWDSIGGTSTDSILDPDPKSQGAKLTPMERGKKAMMVKAKLISAGMEIINPLVAKSKVAYVYTNTLYQRPDVDYGDPWETPGGNKKNFFATVRLRLKVIKQLQEVDADTDTKDVVAQVVEVSALKNSMAPRKRTIPAVVRGGVGFSNDDTIKMFAESMKIITGTTWMTWKTPKGEEVKYQGWNGFKLKIVPHPEYPSLVEQVLGHL